jgi:hypothetical protein
MPYINVHVDLDDIYDDLTSSDKRELVELLTDDGYIEPEPIETSESLQNEEFNEACKKLASSYYRLSQEDEKIITDLIKKYN